MKVSDRSHPGIASTGQIGWGQNLKKSKFSKFSRLGPPYFHAMFLLGDVIEL